MLNLLYLLLNFQLAFTTIEGDNPTITDRLIIENVLTADVSQTIIPPSSDNASNLENATLTGEIKDDILLLHDSSITEKTISEIIDNRKVSNLPNLDTQNTILNMEDEESNPVMSKQAPLATQESTHSDSCDSFQNPVIEMSADNQTSSKEGNFNQNCKAKKNKKKSRIQNPRTPGFNEIYEMQPIASNTENYTQRDELVDPISFLYDVESSTPQISSIDNSKMAMCCSILNETKCFWILWILYFQIIIIYVFFPEKFKFLG